MLSRTGGVYLLGKSLPYQADSFMWVVGRDLYSTWPSPQEFFILFPFKKYFGLPSGMWDLSSPTRDGTHNPCSGSWACQPPDLQGSPSFCFCFSVGFLSVLKTWQLSCTKQQCQERAKHKKDTAPFVIQHLLRFFLSVRRETLGPVRGQAGYSLVAQIVKHLPRMQETRVPSLGWEDPLEKEMATHCSALAQKIPWVEEPGGLQSMGSQRVRHD